MTATVDLDAIGAGITGVDDEARLAARELLAARHPTVGGGHGRLAELALWWAAARGTARPAGPQRTHWVGVPAGGGIDLPAEIDVDEALAWGVATADALADRDADLIVLGVVAAMPARIVAAELMGLDSVEAAGWPQDRPGADDAPALDDDGWMDDVVQLRDGLRRTAGLRGDPVALLRAAGSPRLAAATALLVQAAVRRTPVLLDGFGAGAAALLARRTAYVANQWWLVGQRGRAPLQARILRSLQLEPLTDLGVTAEDGTGARLGLAVLEVAVALLADPPADPPA